jgi:hypothetical protein
MLLGLAILVFAVGTLIVIRHTRKGVEVPKPPTSDSLLALARIVDQGRGARPDIGIEITLRGVPNGLEAAGTIVRRQRNCVEIRMPGNAGYALQPGAAVEITSATEVSLGTLLRVEVLAESELLVIEIEQIADHGAISRIQAMWSESDSPRRAS